MGLAQSEPTGVIDPERDKRPIDRAAVRGDLVPVGIVCLNVDRTFAVAAPVLAHGIPFRSGSNKSYPVSAWPTSVTVVLVAALARPRRPPPRVRLVCKIWRPFIHDQGARTAPPGTRRAFATG